MNPFGTEEFLQFRQVFGLHRFKLHRHLVDGTVKSAWLRPVFGLLRVWFRQVFCLLRVWFRQVFCLFRVWFRQVFCLLRVRFKQVSLILNFQNVIQFKTKSKTIWDLFHLKIPPTIYLWNWKSFQVYGRSNNDKVYSEISSSIRINFHP